MESSCDRLPLHKPSAASSADSTADFPDRQGYTLQIAERSRTSTRTGTVRLTESACEPPLAISLQMLLDMKNCKTDAKNQIYRIRAETNVSGCVCRLEELKGLKKTFTNHQLCPSALILLSNFLVNKIIKKLLKNRTGRANTRPPERHLTQAWVPQPPAQA